MLTFWSIAGLMVVLAGAIIAIPLWRRPPAPSGSRDDANARLSRERLAELDAERQAGRLDEATYQQLRQDVARTLLADVPVAAPEPSGQGAGLRGALAVVLLIPLAALGYYYVSSYRGEARDWIELQARLGATVAEAIRRGEDLPPEARQDLPGFTRVLQARVLREGMNDPDALFLLGRGYLALDQPPAAALVLARAYTLNPRQPAIMLAYAQALLLSNEGRLNETSTQLLQTVLQLNPDHQGALMLYGFGAFNGGAFEDAARYWRRLEALLDPASEGAQLVRNSIARAESLRAQGGAKPDGEAAASRIAVTVDVAPELRARLTPQDTLFVFAKAAAGPPMPLAVARQPVGDFPARVVLDDSQAMTPALKLSAFKQVVVSARISKSGDATAQTGDLQGVTAALELGAGEQAVALVIDQVVP